MLILGIEGIDGSGKGTQIDILHQRLVKEGFRVHYLDFPRYDTFIGAEIGKRLAGDATLNASQLPVEDFSLWYAVDRQLAFQSIPADTQIILLNRSTYSNIGYQVARLPKEKQEALKRWIYELEFNVLGIPKPDCMIYLRINPTISQQLVQKKEERTYVQGADLYEKDLALLQASYNIYNELAETEENFRVVECLAENGQLRSITDVSKEVFDVVLRLLGQLRAE